MHYFEEQAIEVYYRRDCSTQATQSHSSLENYLDTSCAEDDHCDIDNDKSTKSLAPCNMSTDYVMEFESLSVVPKRSTDGCRHCNFFKDANLLGYVGQINDKPYQTDDWDRNVAHIVGKREEIYQAFDGNISSFTKILNDDLDETPRFWLDLVVILPQAECHVWEQCDPRWHSSSVRVSRRLRHRQLSQGTRRASGDDWGQWMCFNPQAHGQCFYQCLSYAIHGECDGCWLAAGWRRSIVCC